MKSIEQNALNFIAMPENEKQPPANEPYPFAFEKFKNYSNYHIIEQQWSYGSEWVNASLKKDLKIFENVPDESKIRLVYVSKGWVGGKKGHEEILPLITRDRMGVFLC